MNDPARIYQENYALYLSLYAEQKKELENLRHEISERDKKIITLEAIIIALGLKDNISKKLAAEAAFEGES